MHPSWQSSEQQPVPSVNTEVTATSLSAHSIHSWSLVGYSLYLGEEQQRLAKELRYQGCGRGNTLGSAPAGCTGAVALAAVNDIIHVTIAHGVGV